ncbi:hypothetical protein [Algoriphagus persicinus]|uniref:hypothetical protein n=1 Tax=Algoriphagus persicinus TaxID=3108754 RepID=UPI002B38ECBF|nr:hypothetical protein [Algoriphagus sp. E1-3-M2]MEB2785435.1 hypothetical protein [Algoriphagus sp. E1-3-M2]
MDIAQAWERRGLVGEFTSEIKLNRQQVSVLLDELLDPFSIEVDWHGRILIESK